MSSYSFLIRYPNCNNLSIYLMTGINIYKILYCCRLQHVNEENNLTVTSMLCPVREGEVLVNGSRK